jgi:hypothetical protein
MWADVGHYVPALGPCGLVIALTVPAIAVLATLAITWQVSKSRIPAGEIRIRMLGIRVRWDQTGEKLTHVRDSKVADGAIAGKSMSSDL